MAEIYRINYYTKGIYEKVEEEKRDNNNNFYTIPSTYKIVKWNKNKYPLYINYSIFDSEELMQWINEWLIEFKYNKLYDYNSALSTNKKLFVQFRSLNTRMILIQELKLKVQDNEELELLVDFMNGAIKINNRLQNILNECTNHIIAARKKTIIISNNDIKLYILECMNILFNTQSNLYKLQQIENNINIWVQRFDINCTF